MKILIVDDNPANRELLGVTLASAGHETQEASDGVEALEKLHAEAFDAVISDVLMPRMDGYRLCYEMRRDERIRGLPFIVYTSIYTSPADEAVAIQAGADRFIRNPASVAQFEQALLEITSAHRKGDTAARAFAAIEVLKQYNEGLIWRLKEKNIELEAANRNLETEIQDRRISEEALRESEERYRGLFENNLAGVFRSTADGRLLDCNEAFARMFGYGSPEEIKAQPLQNLYPNPKAWQDFVAHVREKGSVTDRENFCVRKDGRPIWVLNNTRIISQPGAQPEILEGTLVDITDRKLAEEALRQSEERYRDIFDASPLPKWLYSLPDLRILDVNKAAVDHYGYSREEFLAMTLFDIRPPEEADRLHEAMRTVVDRPARWHAGIRKHRKKDGTLIDVDVHTHSIVVGGQNAQLALILDVTERLRLEEQFRQTQKLEAIGQLAGGIAHDFNNLLMIVQSYSELLEMHIGDEKAIRRDIAEIRGAAVRGAAMTGQLLAFSRKQIVRPQIFEPGKVMADLGKMLRRLIREDIQLEIRVEPGSGSIEIDPGQLEQVLVNLVVNARDAMPTGGCITIDVRGMELDQTYAAGHAGVTPGPFVQITVTDTGTGMDAATKRRIFEPFFTTKGVGRGTGLGLATVYGIVKAAGGDVNVYSEPGHGSVFKIYLPRVEAPAVAATAETTAPPAVSNGMETLLILEDEEVIREMLREYLERLGYSVLEAGNGDDALRIAREHANPIHLLLTDVVVPGRSGRSVAEALLQKNPSLRVIFMSGYTDDAAVVRDVKANEVDFLQKPFGLELLARKIREVLDRVNV